jgi:hypothetical protein
MINQDSPHQLGRDAKEVSAILPTHLLLVYQPYVGLVDERRGLKGVSWVFPAHVAPCKLSELSVDERQKLIECRLVSLTPIHQ